MKTLFQLSFPLNPEIMTTVRLAAGGVCAMQGLDLDTGEDCKVCITESLLLLMHRGCDFARVFFFEDGALCVRVEGEGDGEGESCPEDEISMALLSALLGEVETEQSGGKLRALMFKIGIQA